MLSDDHIRRAILTTFQVRNGADWARFPHIVEDEIRALRRNVSILTASNLVVVDLAELEAALKPFADEASSEGNIRLSLGADIDHWPLGPNALTLGDLRRAAALLAALTQERG